MRIISKFRDYYDSVQSYGQDDELIYVRNEFEEIRLFEPRLIRNARCYNVTRHDEVEQKMVGFCGKIYPVIKLSMTGKNPVEKYCYTLDEVEEFIKNFWDKPRQEQYLGKYYNYRYYSVLFTRKSLMKFFEDVKVQVDSFGEVFKSDSSPVFIAEYGKYYREPSKIVYNACLKDVEFYRIFDTYSAYQEISMYLGGVLGLTRSRGKPSYQGQKMDDTVSDKDLIVAKGFDKYSFRKDKEK